MSTQTETILFSLALALARYQNENGGEPPDMLVIHTSRADELKAEFNKQKLYAAEAAVMPPGALLLYLGIPVYASPFLESDQIVATRDMDEQRKALARGEAIVDVDPLVALEDIVEKLNKAKESTVRCLSPIRARRP